jgi:transposase
MQIDLAALPSDIEMLHRLVRDLAAQMAGDQTELAEARAEVKRLNFIIHRLQRSQFGRRSEQIDADQLALGLEDIKADIARAQAPHPEAPASDAGGKPTPRRQGIPGHLPREDVKKDIERHICPCCGGALHTIGETVSEMLDFVPARLRVLRIRRPKYGCRACGTIHQAPAPERPIAKGLASPGLLAHVLVSKYCDHTPLYRQSQIFARQGVEIERSTLANWVGGACWWLEPLQARLAAHVFGSGKIFADDTPIPVLDPGRGRTKTGRLWVYARDDRPWVGPDPPAAIYFYSPDRKAERPASHLEGFRGVLQVDGYAGFERLTARGDIVLAACWAHYLEYSFMWSSCGVADFWGPERITSAHRTPHNPQRVTGRRRVRGRHCRFRYGRCRASRRTSPTRNGMMPACRAAPCIRRVAAPLLATAAMRA